MQFARLFPALLWLAYPLVIYFGLIFLEPRYVALVLVAQLLLRRRHDLVRMVSGSSRSEVLVFLGLLVLCGAAAASNSEVLLRFYPAAVNGGVLLLFGMTLKSPPTMIERFARLREAALPPEGVHYTMRLTQIWCVFLAVNGAIALWTALYASRETWALYNGLLAYLMMGALFAGDILYRRLRGWKVGA
jgi:uncharacterized membrane protein